jgi:hypothetical protein
MSESSSKVPQLTSNNYKLWKSRVKIALVAKGFPDEIFLPNGATKIRELNAGASGITVPRAVSLILRYVDDTTLPDLEALLPPQTPHSIITYLDQIHLSNHTSRLTSLIETFTSLKMHERGNIRDHVHALTTWSPNSKNSSSSMKTISPTCSSPHFQSPLIG